MTTTQLPLDLTNLVEPNYAPDLTIQQRYEAWIALNPWVLAITERLIADWLGAGHKRVGIKQCWEVIRYQYGVTIGDQFKANNNYTSRVARDVLARHPEWSEAISTRELRAA